MVTTIATFSCLSELHDAVRLRRRDSGVSAKTWGVIPNWAKKEPCSARSTVASYFRIDPKAREKRASNAYQAWIDTYAGEEFHIAMRAIIETTNEAADTASATMRDRMHAAYTRATQLEWSFWDSAYRLETWPI